MYKNESGAGLVAVLVVIVILTLVGVVGWRIYDASNENTKQGTVVVQPEQKAEDIEAAPEDIAKELGLELIDGDVTIGASDSDLDVMDFVASYKMPKDWKVTSCHDEVTFIPKGTEEPNCAANQPGSVIYAALMDNHNYIDPSSCKITEPKSKEALLDERFKYSCKEVLVGEKNGIRETVVRTTDGSDEEASVNISYSFPADGKLLVIGYEDYGVKENKKFTKVFDVFVRTFNFM